MWRAVCRVVALFAVMLLVVSCGTSANLKPKTSKKNVNNPTFNLILDVGFGGPERELIIDSFKEWQRDTNGVVNFVVAKYTFDPSLEEIPEVSEKCTYDVYVLRINSTNEVVRKLDKRDNAKVLGFTSSNCDQRIVALVTDRLKDAKMFRQVTVHEAGHLVGLDHIPVPKESIMFPSVDKATACPTRLDMAQLCLLYDCDYNDMKYCDVESQ